MSNLARKPRYRASVKQEPKGQREALVIERLGDGEELFRLSLRNQVRLRYRGQIGNFSLTELSVVNGKCVSTLSPVDKDSAKLCDRVRREVPARFTLETEGMRQEFWLEKDAIEFSLLPWPVDDYIHS